MTRSAMRLLAGMLAGVSSVALQAAAAEVTPQRLLNAAREPQNWLMVYGSYNNYMNSALTQINRTTVSGLRYKFSVALGGMEPGAAAVPSQQATPLVEDGYLYVANAWNNVLKIDVRSGQRGNVLWENDPKVDKAHARLIAIRGIALSGKNVYNNTTDARLVAVNMDTGETTFDVSTVYKDAPANQSHTGAPLAVKNKILVGQANGHTGNRGWVGAFDAITGALAWRFNVIPGPGEPGHETWADGHNAWQTGGGAIWTSPAYDPETNVVIYGTGDPAPWGDPEFRPGDNLYAVSTIALDADTGKLRWHFQETPNESWDYDTVNPRMLIDVTIDGQPRKISANFSRNGFYYTLDRQNGAFISGKPWTEVTWTAGLDPKTGKPLEYNPGVRLQAYSGKSIRHNKRDVTGLNVCPHHSGAPTYFPPTYDAKRMVAYSSGAIGCGDYFNNAPLDPAQDYKGQRLTGWQNVRKAAPAGNIYGVDVRTGQVVKKVLTQYSIYSGLLGTAGDLIFTGHLDGKFAAYDADTLAEVWSINVGTPIAAPPISYSFDGKQYIAVAAGGQDRSAGILAPELGRVKPSSMLFVFGL